MSNWKWVLGGAFLLVVVWAFTPSCATRKGAEAERQAQEAIQSAKQHEGRADAAEEALGKQAKETAKLLVRVDESDKEKATLTAEVARLRKVLPPRPPKPPTSQPHVPGPGVGPGGSDGVPPGDGSDGDGSLVQQLYDVVDAQAALIAKHVESDKEEVELRASLEKSLDFAITYGNEQKARGDDMERALVAKDLQLQAVKAAGFRTRVRDGLIVAVVTYVASTTVRR